MTTVISEQSSKMSNRPRLRFILFPQSEKVKPKLQLMEVGHDLEHSMRYFLLFGKLIGLYPSSQMWYGSSTSGNIHY